MPEPIATPPAAPATPAFDAAVLNGLQGPAFHAVLPEEIRAKPYVKDINSFGDFVKKFDGAQALLGKPIVPGENATPEEWNAFFAKAGRPEKADAYVIPDIDGVPKEFVQKASEIGLLKQIMHAAGLNQQQAKVFASGFLKSIYDAEKAETAAADAAFEKTMDSVFGQDKQAILENGKKFLATTLPDAVRPYVAGLDDKAMAVVIAATDAIVKKHIQEDGFRGNGTPPPAAGADTKESIAAQMREVMAQKEYGDPFLNKTKHAELLLKMEDLRARLRKIS
jgi:hypothetical protein